MISIHSTDFNSQSCIVHSHSSFSLSLSLSVCLCVSLSVYMSVCLSVCLSLKTHVHFTQSGCNCVDVSVWVNSCDPRECACCVSLRHFKSWWPWELHLLKFLIIIFIIVYYESCVCVQVCYGGCCQSYLPSMPGPQKQLHRTRIGYYEKFCVCPGLLWQVLSELSALHARATETVTSHTYRILWKVLCVSRFTMAGVVRVICPPCQGHRKSYVAHV